MSSKNCIFDSFATIESRIKKITKIDKQKELIKILETSEATYSRRKNEKNFKIEWAFILAQKYGLSTDWILTGQGPKYRDGKPENEIILKLDQWLKEISKNDPEKKIWFKIQIERDFPEFKEWLKREEKRENNSDQKVA